ncbi:nucleoside-diphosphate sugar epimerase/dehydratase [Paenibacillus sp. GYB004]|uniref:polysaccharide biosynthesis protein n=1 Tax=Paenibacillus sp. GYB004 TaxID=2994393 RepID=UPI002F96A9EF
MSYSRRLTLLIAIDSLLILIGVCGAYLLNDDGIWSISNVWQFMIYAFLAAVFTTGSMYLFKLYSRIWQYASVGEMLSIIMAVMLSSFICYLVGTFVLKPPITFTLHLRSFETIILLIGGSRFAWRSFRHVFSRQRWEMSREHRRKALIIGAGECGSMIVKELLNDPSSQIIPVAYIDDDRHKHKLQVHGLEVYGCRQKIAEAVEKYGIDEIIIALPSVSKKEITQLIDICKLTKAKLKLIPKLGDLIHGKISVKEIRDVDVEDLLGRDPIKLDLEGIANYVEKKTVLVTGAGGSIGSELCRQIALFRPKKLLLLGHGENSIFGIEHELRRNFPRLQLETIIADVQDRMRIFSVFEDMRPAVVFHAAAHKHVPLMERNPQEAVKNNVFGTRNVADAAHRFGTERFVLISTDKAVNPTSVMGTTKRIAEMYIQSLNPISQTRFAAVRFGNVLGSRGSVIPSFKEQIARGGPVTVTHPDMIRYFMTIPEAVQLVIQAGALSAGGEVFILDMGEPVRIQDLAEDLIRLSGFEPFTDIDIQYSGIRPGEKLYEELLTSEEGISSTKHDRIFIGKPSQTEHGVMLSEIGKLERYITEDANIIVELLGAVVPSYQQIGNGQREKEKEKTKLPTMLREVTVG